ncbi:MAG: PIN domain-containing protein [Planctomycetia bacterium]|uniref:type II toxin-antitoxin system VapC family toxin n=1 Tax=Candidatus Kuenenia TaxID=380738 RepID=UPI00146F5D1D|nr:PIN domain-containing protein [Candidatus Kuenenia stuttgartiensis]MBE7546272.1 PIN domain-containing protein [Planctomycetia bacterium]MCL4743423.1 PIN domain-containing protein [Phycisphaerales bacterium]
MKVYLDTSALNRIFDDQSQPKIYLEATSMLLLFMLIDCQNVEIVSSDVLLFENATNPYEERSVFVSFVLQKAGCTQSVDAEILSRSQEIEKCGLKGMDALHIACAEKLKVDFFITCDDKILKRYKGSVNVQNPIDFIINILRKEENNGN